MRHDVWRAYLDMALGVTELSRKQATKAVKQVLGRGGATAEQLQGLAEDLVRTGMANRDAITKLVSLELDRALSRVGLATVEEVAELTVRIGQLEAELHKARSQASDGDRAVAPPAEAPVKKDVGIPAEAEAVVASWPSAASATGSASEPKKRVAKKVASKLAGAGATASSAKPVPVPAEVTAPRKPARRAGSGGSAEGKA